MTLASLHRTLAANSPQWAILLAAAYAYRQCTPWLRVPPGAPPGEWPLCVRPPLPGPISRKKFLRSAACRPHELRLPQPGVWKIFFLNTIVMDVLAIATVLPGERNAV